MAIGIFMDKNSFIDRISDVTQSTVIDDGEEEQEEEDEPVMLIILGQHTFESCGLTCNRIGPCVPKDNILYMNT